MTQDGKQRRDIGKVGEQVCVAESCAIFGIGIDDCNRGDPSDALIPFIPQNALAHVKVDYCLPVAEIAPSLVRLTSETENNAVRKTVRQTSRIV